MMIRHKLRSLGLALLLLLGLVAVAWPAVDSAVCTAADQAGCTGTNLRVNTNEELQALNGRAPLALTGVAGTNTITACTSPAIAAYVDRQIFSLKPAANNTGATTLNLCSIAAKPVVSASGVALAASDLQSSSIYMVVWYAANDQFRVVTSLGAGVTLANNSVTNAKLAQMPASTLKCNPTGSAANAQDCTLGTNLSFAGTVLNATGGGGGSPGGSSGQVQYNNAGAFGGFTASGDATINTGTGAVTIAAAAVSNAKLANMAANSIKCNNTGSSAAPIDCTLTQASTLLAGAGLGVDSNGKLRNLVTPVAKSSAYTVVLADNGDVISVTNATTLTLTAAATLGNGFWFIATNDNAASSGTATVVDPNGSETVDGVLTSTDYPGAARLYYTDGSNWSSRLLRGGYAVFATPGANNFVVPNAITRATVQAIGGGGGGGGGGAAAAGAARLGGTGGGGGGKCEFEFQGADLGTAGSTITATVGAGGTSGAGVGVGGGAGSQGGAGGNSTFGTLLTGYGGGGGRGGTAGTVISAGGGGGCGTAGANGSAAAVLGGDQTVTNVAGFGTSGGGATTNVNTNPFPAQTGGGAGGGNLTIGAAGGPGGTSLFGGPGGGGGAGAPIANTAAAGGAGGNSGVWVPAGGGGGAGGTNAGTAGSAGVAGAGQKLGTGGGGGGFDGNTTCGSGGNGGAPAAGGGGGAACTTGTAAGNGGVGGRGEIRIWYSLNDNVAVAALQAA